MSKCKCEGKNRIKNRILIRNKKIEKRKIKNVLGF